MLLCHVLLVLKQEYGIRYVLKYINRGDNDLDVLGIFTAAAFAEKKSLSSKIAERSDGAQSQLPAAAQFRRGSTHNLNYCR